MCEGERNSQLQSFLHVTVACPICFGSMSSNMDYKKLIPKVKCTNPSCELFDKPLVVTNFPKVNLVAVGEGK